MNDFTKYELQSLLWAVQSVRDVTSNCGDVLRRIEKKIQSMSDNYCEHENIYTGSGTFHYCNDCARVFLRPSPTTYECCEKGIIE